MMQNKSITILSFFFLLLLPNFIFAQDLGEILFGPDSKSNYMGQYDFKGKRKNGYGIERYRNGNLYVGDFSKGKVSGRGMLLALEAGIPNVENAVVYVGNWLNGKKEGKGVCYDSSGNIVYKGSFSKDKPLSSASIPAGQSFSTIDIDEELYIGEIADKVPNGYGLKLQLDGSIVFGMFKNGSIRGVCMTLFSPDDWEVGQWIDGKYRSFNNATDANNRSSEYLALAAEHRKQVRAELFSATMNFADAAMSLAVNIKENKDARHGTASGDLVGEEEGLSDGMSYDYYHTKYKIWTSKAKNTYEDNVRYRVKATDYRSGQMATAAARLLRTQQRMMRQIRKTAKKNGHNIPKSKYEDIAF